MSCASYTTKLLLYILSFIHVGVHQHPILFVEHRTPINSDEPRGMLSIEPKSNALGDQIVLCSRSNYCYMGFFVLWLCGWVVGAVLALVWCSKQLPEFAGISGPEIADRKFSNRNLQIPAE